MNQQSPRNSEKDQKPTTSFFRPVATIPGVYNPWTQKAEAPAPVKVPVVQTAPIGVVRTEDKKVEAPAAKKENPKIGKRKRGRPKKVKPETVLEPVSPQRSRRMPVVKAAKTDGLRAEALEQLSILRDEVHEIRKRGGRQTCSDEALRVARFTICCSSAEAVVIAQAIDDAEMNVSEYFRHLFFDVAKIGARPHREKAAPRLVTLALARGSVNRKKLINEH